MRPGVRDFLARLRALTGPILIVWGAGMHPALSKAPGEVHCYHVVCHRVLTVEETAQLVGNTRILIASYYDDPHLDGFNTGQLTSSGEKFDANNTGRVASSIFPDGTELLVWNPLNGRAAHVRVNDFGPFRSNRTLDLTAALAKNLDVTRKGVIGLQVTVIAPPASNEPSYRKFRTYPKTKGYLGMYDEEALGALAKNLTAEALTRSARADSLPMASDIPLPQRKPSVRFGPRDTIRTENSALEELSEARPDELALSQPPVDIAPLPAPAPLPLTEVPSALVVAFEPLRDWRPDHFKVEPSKFATDSVNFRLARLSAERIGTSKAPPLIVLFFLVAASCLGMTMIRFQRQKRESAVLLRVWQERTADEGLRQADGAAPICEVSIEMPRASIIGRDLQITGSLVTCNKVILEGRIEGDCVCGRLLIKPAGKLLGDVIAEEVLVAGSTKGRVMAKTVSVAGKAVVTGQVDYCDLIVERGAALEAKVRRMPTDAWMTSGQTASANAGSNPKPSLSLATFGSRLFTSQQRPSRIVP